MGIISWIVLGLIAGFIASKLVNHTGSGMLMDIVLGIVGAVVGGYIATALGMGGVSGFNLYSIIIAALGAVVVLLVYQAVTGSRRTY
ncbi:putative membrane protein YeaQ/YmgE (transglycosylase-associated protein family) [Rhodoblastus acidophilus]|uniref:GlsB/YeaQ/YmgE family stress response membrane protein n=1 Tax=Rhodoblastus acidophilus TaxID=1074 RepID=UPI001608F002|nr:GlsB/YeaQ/YmgE family stress response membrane protein [Rhodoblastus acidophilus]MCW2284882.1 putative membrane protein YeaQ/YmgE (transglycosylase-associated protein family) [Rhodoblastus acidophilus]MCW2333828.1 putative membrane protein YeaQ/YmgE (transglycosylase-associated protein family) [Rhodoblastus acidophilus]